MKLSPTEIYKDKTIFFIGGTGFVGKVTLSMLLHNFPDVGKVYVTVRARDENESQTRFWTSIVTSPTFDPLREKYGDKFEDFIREKVVAVNGDVGNEYLGMPEEQAREIMEQTDIILNGAGNVTFNPPLESALRTNVVGSNNIIKLARMMKKPRVVHVSTCFVAGKRSGAVWETEPVVGYFPRRNELVGTTFDVNREVEDCTRLGEQARQEADDAVQQAKFREQARQRFIEEGRDPDEESELKSAIFRERKMWIRERTTELGAARAEYWGWTNIYTYSKSLAEQIIASQDDIIKCLVRPSIVESSQEYPFPGWNEGFTTTAPLIMISLQGQPVIPVNEKLVLDVIPVDMVAGVILAATMNTLVDDNPPLVYQASSGDSNPNDMKRIVGLVGLYKRRHFEEMKSGNFLLNKFSAMIEATPVSQKTYELTSAPMMQKLAGEAGKLLDRATPTWGGGRIGNIFADVKKTANEFGQKTQATIDAFAMFKPFMIDNAYIFRSDNVRALISVIKEKEKHLLPWFPERLDWYDYWLNVHFPGMKKWVLPALEEGLKAQEKRAYTYKDLIDMFDTAVKRFPTRIAMRIERNGEREQYSFENIRELVLRSAGFLVNEGFEPGERMLLVCENTPEWGSAYFGILKAGYIAVTVDPSSSIEEILDHARTAEVSTLLISDRILQSHPGLKKQLKKTRTIPLSEVFEMQNEKEAERRTELLPKKIVPNSAASIVFTQGTDGQRKPVVLSHRNFVNMLSMLSSVIEMDTSDGVLSVISLSHPFEFSTGLLLPFSAGATINYLDEVNADELSNAMENGQITALAGVPAMWEMLHNRIKGDLRKRGDWTADLAESLIDFNSWLRDNTPFNLGPAFFLPIHRQMGGKIRFMLSGGSGLNDGVKKDLHGLGFTVLEGYGMAESSPLVAIDRPGNKKNRGSVGTPLPGIEIRIDNADKNGVGEIYARGQNIMLGYYNDQSATDEVLTDRWLRTGDIGKLDEDGVLHIIERADDIIIDSGGNKIYPHELEKIYAETPYIKEIYIAGISDGYDAQMSAALIVPNLDEFSDMSMEEIEKRIEGSIREKAVSKPYEKRLKNYYFSYEKLPRTSIGSIKRDAAFKILSDFDQRSEKTTSDVFEANKHEDLPWLKKLISNTSGKPQSEIKPESRLSDLGFDPLMFVELETEIENSGGIVLDPDSFADVQTVRELTTVVRRSKKKLKNQIIRNDDYEAEHESEIFISPAMRDAGNILLEFGQEALYENILNVIAEGTDNVPVHVNFIIAANHLSHLDTGLIKKAIGTDVAKQTVAVATPEYWFDSKYKRAYLENFTNMVPLERSGNLRRSIRNVAQQLAEGMNALVYPEGTRSTDGEMRSFNPALGYLAFNQKIGILPTFIWGTFDVLPKSATIPSKDFFGAKVGVKFGRFIEYEEIVEMTVGLRNYDAYKLITERVRFDIENLKLGKNDKFERSNYLDKINKESQ